MGLWCQGRKREGKTIPCPRVPPEGKLAGYCLRGGGGMLLDSFKGNGPRITVIYRLEHYSSAVFYKVHVPFYFISVLVI